MTEQLNIIFNTCFNTEEKLFGYISYNTIFTVFITIIVFFGGVIAQKKLEKSKIKRQLKSVKGHFSFLIKILPESYIIPQIQLLKEFYLNANIDTGINVIPPLTISGDLQRFKEFKSQNLFKAFGEYSKSDIKIDLYKILSLIDSLYELNKIINKYHKFILANNNELRKEIQYMIEDYLDLIAKSIRKIKETDANHLNNPLWVYLNKMLIDYYEIKNHNNTISFLYKFLLRPIQEELVTKGYDRENIYAEKITLLGKKITTRRFYLRHQTISIKLQYRQFYFDLINVNDDFSIYCKNIA